MEIANSYYGVGLSNLDFVKECQNVTNYTAHCLHLQLAAECLLKSVLELEVTEWDEWIDSHNLRKLATLLENVSEMQSLDVDALSNLHYTFKTSQYPGPEFFSIEAKEFTRHLQTTYSVLSAVDTYRSNHDCTIPAYDNVNVFKRREKPIAGPLVVAAFKSREQQALDIIRNYGIPYLEIGIFGSYARNMYKSTSDINMVIISEELADLNDRSYLRCELDDIDVDIHFITKSHFEHVEGAYMSYMKRDYIRSL